MTCYEEIDSSFALEIARSHPTLPSQEYLPTESSQYGTLRPTFFGQAVLCSELQQYCGHFPRDRYAAEGAVNPNPLNYSSLCIS